MAAILGLVRTFYPEVALEFDWLPSSDINEVTPVENFDSFFNMVTSSMKQLTIFSADMVIQQWHIYT